MWRFGPEMNGNWQLARDLRHELRLPLRAVAEASGLSISLLHGFENGKHGMSPDLLRKLSEFYSKKVRRPVDLIEPDSQGDDVVPTVPPADASRCLAWLLSRISPDQVKGYVNAAMDEGRYDMAQKLIAMALEKQSKPK